MKVETYGAPQVEAQANVPGSIQLERPDNSALVRGIEAGADALGTGIDEAKKKYDKWMHEARSTDVANGLAAYANTATDAFHGAPADPSTQVVGGSAPALQATSEAIDAATAAGDRTVKLDLTNPAASTGFLGTRGKEAAAAEKPLFDSLAQRRDQIASGFTDPETKKLFLQRVQQYDIDLREKALAHVAHQADVASEDAAANLSDAAVRSAAADPGNDKLAAALFGEAAGAVRGLYHGRPDIEAKHDRELRAEIAGTRIEALLGPGPQQNVAKAREVLEANRGVIGKQLDNYERAIAQAEKALKKQDLDDAAEGVAQGLMGDATDALTGKVDEAKLWGWVDEVKDTKERDNVRARVRTRLVEQDAVFKRNTDALMARAHAEYNRVGSVTSMSAETIQTLNSWPDKEAPAMLDSFMAKDRERFRLARSSRSEANREQREANEEALRLFNAQGSDVTSQPGAVEDFLAKFPKVVNDLGVSALRLAARQGKNVADKGQAIGETQFVEQTLAEAKGWRPANAKEATVWRDKLKSDAVNAYAAYMEDHAGKPPDKAEAAKIRSKLILAQPLEPTNPEQMAASAGAAAVQGGGSRSGIGGALEAPKAPEWTPEQKKKAADALRKKNRPVNDANIDAVLRLMTKTSMVLPPQAPPPVPHNAQELADAGDDYGLDLTPTPKQDVALDRASRKIR